MEKTRLDIHHENAPTTINAAQPDVHSRYADLAHDLKASAAVLLNALNLLEAVHDKMDVLDAMMAKYLPVMQYATNQILRLSDQVLDVERLRAGSLPMQPHLYNLGQYLPVLCGYLRPDFQQKGLELHYDGQLGEVWVRCDIGLIERLLMNLLTNAVKYTVAGGSVIVSVTTGLHDLFLSVRDTGCGIDPEMQRRIFDRYVTTNGSRDGTGLGLSLVREIARLHGGTVEVCSVPGQGSCFTVRLPLPSEPLDEQDKHAFADDLNYFFMRGYPDE